MHDDEAPHRVLRIPMPGPDKKECFIAISFDRALDQVSGAIAEAVSAHGFTFKRVDLSPEGPKWTENVPEGIREAAVVIAVINNKADANCRINANVAYELGVAHALGKPLIIIADDTKNTDFSDIGHFNWIESHYGGEFRRRDFIAHLTNALTNVMNASFSHPLWPAATLEDSCPTNNHTRSRLSHLLNSLEHAFRYGKSIHGIFHALNGSHIVALSTSAYDLIYTRDVVHSAEVLRREFSRYQQFYDQEICTFLRDEPFLHNNAETAISELTSDTLTRSFWDIDAYIDNIKGSDNNLRDIHRIAVFRQSCNDRSQNTRLYCAVKHLQSCCNQIVSAADDYLRLLMDIFLILSKENIP